MKKFLRYIIALILLFTSTAFAGEYYTNERGKKVEYGTVVKDYVRLDRCRVSYGTVIDKQNVHREGPAPGSREYWKRRTYREKKLKQEAWEKIIKENKVPYPKSLDRETIAPSYKIVYDTVWHGCCTKNLPKADKLEIINDYMSYYKKLKEGKEIYKTYEYFLLPSTGGLMVRKPNGEITSAELIRWGFNFTIINHKLKTKKNANTIMIYLPKCAKFKKYKHK